MSLVLTDINVGKSDMPEAYPDPIGVIMLDEFGNWQVSRQDGYKVSGSGPVTGLKRNSSWINNLSFEESRSIFNGNEHKQIVRGANWLYYNLNDVLEDWAYYKIPIDQSAGFLSNITGRVFNVINGYVKANKTRNPAKRMRDISCSASMATGLMLTMESGVKKTIPSDDKISEHFQKTYQNGLLYRNEKVSDSEMILDFRFPQLSYALRVARIMVPVNAEWQKANRPDEVSQDEFVREVMGIGRPTIFRAMFEYDPEQHPKWLADIVGHKFGTERTRFLTEEIIGTPEISKRIESALISKGGETNTAAHNALNTLVESFGGERAASLSWTVGLVAENVLAAPHRSGRTTNNMVSAEEVWMAAQDRMLMAPLLRSLTESGCIILSARGGRIRVLAPRVPEVIIAAASYAWDHGAYIGLGQATILGKTLGIDLPTERSSFLGSDEDYLVAAANHSGANNVAESRKALWGFDGICDETDVKKRQKLANDIMNAIA